MRQPSIRTSAIIARQTAGPSLDLESAQSRAAAIAEEKEVGLCLVPLDEVMNLVLIEGGGDVRPGQCIAGGQVELQAGFRLQMGLLVMNPTPDGPRK